MKSLLRSAFLPGLLLLAGSAVSQTTDHLKQNETHMGTTTRPNSEVIRKLYEEGLNKRNLNLLNNLISDEYTGPRGEKGHAGFEHTIQPLLTAFPDIQWHIEELLEDGEKVVIRWMWQGTHTAAFLNIAPSNKIVKNEAIAIYRLKNGKVISANMQSDRLGFLVQTGVVSADVIPGNQQKKTESK